MTTLDRYIARQYLTNTLLLLTLLASFVVMVDLSLNMGRFVDRAGRMVAQSGHEEAPVRRAIITVLVVLDLWWPRLLQLYNFVIGLVLVGAMGFTFAQLVRQRELVAMLAGGVSLYRCARPVLVVAALMMGLQALNQELVIPRIAPLLARDPASAGERQAESFDLRLTADGQRRLWQAARYDPARETLTDVHIWERDQRGRAQRRISAASAKWDGRAWQLDRPTIAVLTMTGRPNESAPVAPASIQTDLDPTAILAARFRTYAQSLSWLQISEALQTPGLRPELRERLERIGWGRAAGMICAFLSLLISMPFFLTRDPRNMVVQSLKCAPVAVIAFLGSVAGTAAPLPGLPPIVGVFVPVVVLGALAIAAVTSIRT